MMVESFRSLARRFLGVEGGAAPAMTVVESGDPAWEGHSDTATCPKCAVTCQHRPQICECGGFIHVRSNGVWADKRGVKYGLNEMKCLRCGGDTVRNYSSDDAERGLHELGLEFFTVSLVDGVKFHSRKASDMHWGDPVWYPTPATIGHVLKTELEKRRDAARQEKAG
jgi:hypothetical protein